jgi:hypothetical protein
MRRNHCLPAIRAETQVAAIVHQDDGAAGDVPVAGLDNLGCWRGSPIPTRHIPHDRLEFNSAQSAVYAAAAQTADETIVAILRLRPARRVGIPPVESLSAPHPSTPETDV